MVKSESLETPVISPTNFSPGFRRARAGTLPSNVQLADQRFAATPVGWRPSRFTVLMFVPNTHAAHACSLNMLMTTIVSL